MAIMPNGRNQTGKIGARVSVRRAVSKKFSESSSQRGKIFFATLEMLLDVAFDYLSVQSLETIASDTLPKGLEERAHLHTGSLDGDLGKFTLIPEMPQVRIENPTIGLPNRFWSRRVKR